MSGNEIVIVSIKLALTNHLDVVTPLSDIYVYIVAYTDGYTLCICVITIYIKDNTTYVCRYVLILTNSNSNGPIRIRFQFAELAV